MVILTSVFEVFVMIGPYYSYCAFLEKRKAASELYKEKYNHSQLNIFSILQRFEEHMNPPDISKLELLVVAIRLTKVQEH